MREEAAKAAAAESADPWRLTLQRVRGKIDFYDGLERISTQTLLDLLEVPQRNRTAGTYRRLAKVMAELGWTAVRVRDLTRGRYKEQVRYRTRDDREIFFNGANKHLRVPAGDQDRGARQSQRQCFRSPPAPPPRNRPSQ
jgi:hypothetical protein